MRNAQSLLLIIVSVLLICIAYKNHDLQERNYRQAITILNQRNEIIDLKRQLPQSDDTVFIVDNVFYWDSTMVEPGIGQNNYPAK